jgi:hypothetical protein
MSVKGKMAVACMLLAIVILWNYGPLVAADDEEDIVDAKYKLYNIYIYFYAEGDYSKLITSLTGPRGGIIFMSYRIVNDSPYDFYSGHFKLVFIWSNGHKYRFIDLYIYNIDIPPGYYAYSNYDITVPSNAPVGKGTLKVTVYGYSYNIGKSVRSYPLKLPFTVT